MERTLQGAELADLDQWWADAFPRVREIVKQYELASASIGRQYYDAIRSLDISTPYTSILADPAPDALYEVSFGVTGPTELKKALGAGLDAAEAKSRATVTLTGSADRIVGDAGRNTVRDNVKKDRVAVGWQRLSSTGSPCYFCAMLISRGPVYKNEGSAGKNSNELFVGEEGQAKVHDHCHCFIEPFFVDEAQSPPVVDEYYKLYQEATKGKSGKAAINAFRRAYEARNKP
jgi:hypothetical protein